MFKELKSLGVVVKELSNELRQLVSNCLRIMLDLFQIAYNFLISNSINKIICKLFKLTAKDPKYKYKLAQAQETHLTQF